MQKLLTIHLKELLVNIIQTVADLILVLSKYPADLPLEISAITAAGAVPASLSTDWQINHVVRKGKPACLSVAVVVDRVAAEALEDGKAVERSWIIAAGNSHLVFCTERLRREGNRTLKSSTRTTYEREAAEAIYHDLHKLFGGAK